MKATITEFHGFDAHWETDHTETDMSNITGAAHYSVDYDDGETEDLVTGLRPGENNAWSLKVIEAAQAWRDGGGEIPEWTEPTDEDIRAAMPTLTARQFRLGLIDSGRTIAQVEIAIAAIEDDGERAKAEIEWEYASEFKRSHPLVVSLSAALEFTPEEVDTLWNEALTL